MDQLIISALKVSTHIGIHAWEERILQPLSLTITIPYDFSQCHDDIKNAVDYDVLCQAVTQFVSSKAFKLIETVAHDVAMFIKEEFKVAALTVRVCKPHAVKNAGGIEVVVAR